MFNKKLNIMNIFIKTEKILKLIGRKMSIKNKSLSTRKPSPYIIFCTEMRPFYKMFYPGATFGEMGRLLGNEWSILPEELKKCYAEKSVAFEDFRASDLPTIDFSNISRDELLILKDYCDNSKLSFTFPEGERFEEYNELLRQFFPSFKDDSHLMFKYITLAPFRLLVRHLLIKKFEEHSQRIFEAMTPYLRWSHINKPRDEVIQVIKECILSKYDRYGIFNMDVEAILTDEIDTITDTSPRDEILDLLKEIKHSAVSER